MFYTKLKEAIKKNGISMYQISKDTGIAQSTISRWKTQNSLPNLKTIKILADYFNVPVTYFSDNIECEPIHIQPKPIIDLKKLTDESFIWYYRNKRLSLTERKKVSKILKALLED
jgi:lexA repressor